MRPQEFNSLKIRLLWQIKWAEVYAVNFQGTGIHYISLSSHYRRRLRCFSSKYQNAGAYNSDVLSDRL